MRVYLVYDCQEHSHETLDNIYRTLESAEKRLAELEKEHDSESQYAYIGDGVVKD